MARRMICTAALGVLVACLFLIPCNEAQGQRRDLGEDARLVIGMLVDTGVIIEDEGVDYARVEVHNDVDRSVNLDFSGTSHYVLQVGDDRRGTIALDPGTYKVRASATALEGASAEISVVNRHIYELRVSSEK